MSDMTDLYDNASVGVQVGESEVQGGDAEVHLGEIRSAAVQVGDAEVRLGETRPAGLHLGDILPGGMHLGKIRSAGIQVGGTYVRLGEIRSAGVQVGDFKDKVGDTADKVGEVRPGDKVEGIRDCDSAYLTRAVGDALKRCLTDLSEKQPHDPIEFMAHWLYNYNDTKTYFEEKITFTKELEKELLNQKLQRREKCYHTREMATIATKELQQISSKSHVKGSWTVDLRSTPGTPSMDKMANDKFYSEKLKEHLKWGKRNSKPKASIQSPRTSVKSESVDHGHGSSRGTFTSTPNSMQFKPRKLSLDQGSPGQL